MPIGHSDRINIGVLAERAAGERRVALIPSDIGKLISKAGFVIESGAGREAGFDDDAYVEAGARIGDSWEILEDCAVVVKVRPPGRSETPGAGRTLISLGGHDPNLGEFLRQRAVIHGFDVRAAAREQVESLGAKFVSVDDSDIGAGEAAGGYAREQSRDQQARLRRALSAHLATMHLVITTAQIPGRPAPLLIDHEALGMMQPGAVIVDLAAETGGNCEFTRPDETVVVNGVRIMGPTNLPSLIARDASRFFSSNIRSLLAHLLERSSRLDLDASDPISGALLAGQNATTSSVAAA